MLMNNKIFNIGDKIAVIDNTITGFVVSIVGNKIELEDADGFVYSYKINEVVLVKEDLYTNISVKPKDKIAAKRTKNSVKIKKQQILEVDLHIHQLTHSNRFMSNKAMLQKQLSVVKLKMNYAIKNKIQKVIFIHGIGQGVLKNEILHLLKKYTVEVNDASYKKYGKGATEVRIFSN